MTEAVETIAVLTKQVSELSSSELMTALKQEIDKIRKMSAEEINVAYAACEIFRAAGDIPEDSWKALKQVFISRMGSLINGMPTQNGKAGHWQDVFRNQTGHPFGFGG